MQDSAFFILFNRFVTLSRLPGIPLLAHRRFFQAGVENFVFISAAGAQHEHALLRGYWKGKQKAEKVILER